MELVFTFPCVTDDRNQNSLARSRQASITLATQEAEAESFEFDASLGNIGGLLSKNKTNKLNKVGKTRLYPWVLHRMII